MLATSSTRRQAQVRALRPDLRIEEIRGNVPTRLEKLADNDGLAGTILAAAGLLRLHFRITDDGRLEGDAVPEDIRAVRFNTHLMLPCVGQGAIGIEIRADDGRIQKICERLNHFNTCAAVTAERAFLRGMGGGCQSPVGALAEVKGERLVLRAESFLNDTVHRSEQAGDVREPDALGKSVAVELGG